MAYLLHGLIRKKKKILAEPFLLIATQGSWKYLCWSYAARQLGRAHREKGRQRASQEARDFMWIALACSVLLRILLRFGDGPDGLFYGEGENHPYTMG